MKNKLCWMCGVYFTPKRKDMVYCTHACRQMAYTVRKKSPWPMAPKNRPRSGGHDAFVQLEAVVGEVFYWVNDSQVDVGRVIKEIQNLLNQARALVSKYYEGDTK